MKISIWQQFSSNHSADFTLVGTFESPEKAEHAGQELRKIIEMIGHWWEEQGEFEDCVSQVAQMAKKKQLTPPEQAIASQYNIDWGREPIDWTLTAEAAKGVEVYRNLVFINPYTETWSSTQPFENLLNLWGGLIACEMEYSEHRLTFTVQFAARDEAHAEKMAQQLAVMWQEFESDSEQFGYPFGSYQRDGLTFSIAGFPVFWFMSELFQRFQDFIGWLEDQQCTIINYAIEETPRPD
ncbi:MAG: hypothetical protein K8L91_31550 [Anaerolineae bacterium]|nr:hypothetical protein [Anaerolineae bacterium]